MMLNRTEFVIKYSRKSKVKSFETLRGGNSLGPHFICHADGTLKKFNVIAHQRRVGTEMCWLDTGSKECELYLLCHSERALIYRLYMIDYLGVEDPQSESQAHFARWVTDFAPVAPNCRETLVRVPELLDPTAESIWCTTEDEGLSDELPRWPNGQIAFLGCRYGKFPSGAAIAFWENGAVRTAAHWDDDGVLGTRSCFADNGDLAAEQNFFRSGWKTGCWVDRYFAWDNGLPTLSKVNIFKGFELVKTVDSPIVRSVWDEALFNRASDPIYEKLRKMHYDPIGDQYYHSDSAEDFIDWTAIENR